MYKIIFFSLVLIFSLTGQELTPHMVMNKTLAIGAKMSPDGKWIAYGEYSYENSDSSEAAKTQVFVVNRESNEKRQFSFLPMKFGGYEWSKNGKYLVFSATLKDMCKNTQVYRMPLNGGGIEQLTHFKKSFYSWKFTPDEKKVTFLRKPEADKFYPYKNDKNTRFAKLYIYDLKEKAERAVSPDSLHVWSYTLGPAGKYAIIQATKDAGVDYSYMFRQLYKVDLESGEVENLVRWHGKMGPAKVSPNGKLLAVQGGIDMGDPSPGSLFIINMMNPMERTNITPGFHGTLASFEWTDNDELIFIATVNAHREMWSADIKGNLDREKSFDLAFSGVSFDQDKKYFATTATAYNHPQEVYVGRVGKDLERITFHNPEFKKINFSKPEEISWKSRDGKTMYGLLYKPLNFKEGQKYPLQVYVHGGPESAVVMGWNNWYSDWPQILAQKGAFTFMPNYRGSTGQGVEFSKADQKDMMGGEFEDIIDGIDDLIKKGHIDEKKVGLGGGSYGGYAAGWAATKYSDRFAVSIMFVGISNQVSKFGTTDTPYESANVHWAAWPYEGNNIELFWDRSPLKYAKNNKTPIFIASGEKDERVPPEQGRELYRALRYYGNAPVDFVVYKGEGHGNRKKGNRYHFMRTSLSWLDKYLFEIK